MHDASLEALTVEIATRAARATASPLVVGLFGCPGSGKSTTSLKLREALVRRLAPDDGDDVIAIVQMDGYHLYKSSLNEDQMRRRGAPDTFDERRFESDLRRLVTSSSSSRETSILKFPSFDHRAGDPVEDAVTVDLRKCKVVIVEGNYLGMWEGVRKLFAMLVWVRVELETAKRRLALRHARAWDWPIDRARERVEKYDFNNMLLVNETANQVADWIVSNEEEEREALETFQGLVAMKRKGRDKKDDGAALDETQVDARLSLFLSDVDSVVRLLSEVSRPGSEREAIVKTLVTIPDTPEFLDLINRESYFALLARAAVDTKSWDLVVKLARRGEAASAALALLRSAPDSSGTLQAPLSTEEWTQIEEECGERWGDPLLMALLETAVRDSALRGACLQSFLAATVFASRVGPPHETLARIVLRRPILLPLPTYALVLSDCVDAVESETILRLLETLTLTWSEPHFPSSATYERHVLVSGVIRLCLARVPVTLSGGEFVTRLLRGIHHHLECNVRDRRALGMLVGRDFSRAMDSSARLEFEELNDAVDVFFSAERTKSGDSTRPTNPADEASRTGSTAKAFPIQREKRSLLAMKDFTNPDRTLASTWPWPAPFREYAIGSERDDVADRYADEPNDNNEDEDDEECSLAPLETQTGGEDVRVRRLRPKHVSECLAILRSDKSSAETTRLALETLPRLLARGEGSADRAYAERYTERICDALLGLEDRFVLPGFAGARYECLVGAVVASPRAAASHLLSLTRRGGRRTTAALTLGQKMLALECVVEGAKRCSTLAISSSSASVSHSPRGRGTRASTVGEEKTRVGEETRLGNRVRRAREAGVVDVEAVTVQNSLVSRDLLRPLVSPLVVACTDELAFVGESGEEPLMLSRLVLSLGEILSLARDAPGVLEMCARISRDVLYWTRASPHLEVRRATLHAYGVMGALAASFGDLDVGRGILAGDLGGNDEEVQEETLEYLTKVAENDNDALCRTMAANALRMICG